MSSEYRFAITMLQGFEPKNGQEALDKIHAEAQRLTAEGKSLNGVVRVEIEGVTRFKNPFPDWLCAAFAIALPELKFDQVNWIYNYVLPDFEAARAYEQKYITWFTDTYESADEQQRKDMGLLHHSIAEHGKCYLEGEELENF